MLLLLLFYFSACRSDKRQVVLNGSTMGTTYQVKIAHTDLDKNVIQQLRSKIDSLLVTVNKQMSTYDPHSEISRFNSYKQTTAFPVSAEFAWVVGEALKIGYMSGKAFDITVGPLVELWGFGRQGQRLSPPAQEEIERALKITGIDNISVLSGTALQKKNPECRLDLGAIAKGYGVDVVSGQLAEAGIRHYMVEIGGEVYAKGLNAQQKPWQIGVDSPDLSSLPGQNIRAILSISGVAVATSGDYRNYFEFDGQIYSHTINPANGKPVDHALASATIIASTCMTADALATAVMVMGAEKGLNLIENIKNVEAMLINRLERDKYEIIYSTGFKTYLQTDDRE